MHLIPAACIEKRKDVLLWQTVEDLVADCPVLVLTNVTKDIFAKLDFGRSAKVHDE